MPLHPDSDRLPGSVDVLVAGGGPSGLFLAADLARRGVRSLVVEPRVELDRLRPRAKTTNARTMTHLRRLGLADALRAAAPLSADWADSVLFCTSLAGREVTRFPQAFQVQPGRYEPQPECGQQVAQPVVEEVLRDAVARSDHATLALGAAFVRTHPDPQDGWTHAVVVDAAGRERVVRCRYLVGADGVSSAVRRDVGLRLEGGSATKSNLGVLFRSASLADRVTLDPAVQYWVVGGRYAGMVGPMDHDGLWWSIVHGYDPEQPRFRDVPTAEVIRALVGVDVDVDVLAEDPWTARMLLAPRYRVGSTLLVGDAAHANPPWGGHGFNTCIGDAANLAWKLAAVLDGWAGPALLDSYEAERRPVARRTIDEAEANGQVLADDVDDPELADDGPRGDRARARAARALQVKEAEFSSLGLVLGYRYADSPIVTPAGDPPPATHPVRYEPSAAPGCLLPHRWVDATTSLYDLLGPGFTVLVAEDAAGTVGALRAALDRTREGVPHEVRVVPGSGSGDAWAAPYVLVRPDQHVAWRGDDPEQLVAALHRAAGCAPEAVSPGSASQDRAGTHRPRAVLPARG